MESEKEDESLLATLRCYSTVIGILCLICHICSDGVLSILFITSILYTITFCYGSASNYHLPILRTMWQDAKLKTLLLVFGTTELACLRIALISLQKEQDANSVSLFLCYLQLFIAFTDNFTVLCRLEKAENRRNHYRIRRFPRNAPAA